MSTQKLRSIHDTQLGTHGKRSAQTMRVPFPWLALALSLSCAPNLDTHSIVFPRSQPARCATFSFEESEDAPAGFRASPRTAMVRSRARQLVASFLRSKGFTEQSEGGDFVVSIGAGRREREIEERLGPIPHPMPRGPVWFEDHEKEELVEGALVIDVFDGGTHQLFWHGGARVELESDRLDESLLRQVTTKVLTSFACSPAKIDAAPDAAR